MQRRRSGNGNAFLPAAWSAFANVAQIIVLLTAADALVQQIKYQIIDAKGGGDMIGSVGEFACDLGRQSGDVPGPVLAGAQEKRADDNAGGAALHAIGVR